MYFVLLPYKYSGRIGIIINLYDHDNKIGSVYPRHAKQLVLKGRASWLEEGKSLIISNSSPTTIKEELPMTSITDSHVYQSNERSERFETERTAPISSVDLEHERLLIAMATKRISERKQFLVHSIMFLPVAFFILLFSVMLRTGDVFFVLAISAWGIGYGAHGIKYAITSGKSPAYPNGIHRAKEIADEVAIIKSYLHH